MFQGGGHHSVTCQQHVMRLHSSSGCWGHACILREGCAWRHAACNGSDVPCCLQLLGLDYLVDAQMHPWLLEVNGGLRCWPAGAAVAAAAAA